MKNLYFNFILLFAISCTSEAAKEGNIPIDTEDASYVSKTAQQTILHNRFFKAYSYQGKTERINKVFKVIQEEIIAVDKEFSDSKLRISPSENTNWTIQSDAHQFHFKNNTIFLEHIADYDHENTFSAFNIETGTHLLDYTYQLLTTRIPSINFKRYIGFVARSNSKNLLKEHEKNTIGVLSYSSEKNLLQKVIIKSKKDVGKNTPSMELIAFDKEHELYDNNNLLYLMNLDENYSSKDLTFAFRLSFYIGEAAEESAIIFEVKNDEINVEDIKYDSKIFQIEIE